MEDLSAVRRAELERARHTVYVKGMGMKRVPIGTDEYQHDSATEVVREKQAELLRMLVKLEDVQASLFQATHLSASSRTTFLVRQLPPKCTTRTREDIDAGRYSLRNCGVGSSQRGAGEHRECGELCRSVQAASAA